MLNKMLITGKLLLMCPWPDLSRHASLKCISWLKTTLKNFEEIILTSHVIASPEIRVPLLSVLHHV